MEKYTYITAGTLSHSAVHVYLRLSHLTTKHYYSYGQWTPSLAGVDSLRVLISNHNNSSFTLCKQLLFPRAISHSPSQLLSRLLMASVYHNILSGRFSPLHLTDSHFLHLTVHPPTKSPATYRTAGLWMRKPIEIIGSRTQELILEICFGNTNGRREFLVVLGVMRYIQTRLHLETQMLVYLNISTILVYRQELSNIVNHKHPR